MIPGKGERMKTSPCPGRRSLKGTMEKMKDVENGKAEEELDSFAGILKG